MKHVMCAIALCGTALAAGLSGQTTGAGHVLRPNAVVHTVADVDRSQTFYQRVLGLELDASAAGPAGASRAATLRIPGTDLRLVLAQFSGVERKPVSPRIQDPGVVKTAFRVRDMDAAFALVEKHISGVLTLGGGPIRPEGPAGANRSVITKDPDGFLVEFARQDVPPLPDNLSATSAIIGGWASLIVEDLAKSIAFYRDSLGFTFSSNGRPLSPLVLSLQGLPDAAGTVSAASKPPGSAYNWFVYEFKGVDLSRAWKFTTTTIELNYGWDNQIYASTLTIRYFPTKIGKQEGRRLTTN